MDSYIICGLGNPGLRYELTRHNIGFLVLDLFSDRHNIPLDQKKFKAVFGKSELFKQKIYLLKPQTFMNLSGETVKEACNFFKVDPQRLLVIHDDLDFPFGSVRIKEGGGPGGHNGLTSIIEQLGTSDFVRIRMGIGRPVGHIDPADYVLQSYSEEQDKSLEDFISRGVEALEVILKDGVSSAMNKYNQRSDRS